MGEHLKMHNRCIWPPTFASVEDPMGELAQVRKEGTSVVSSARVSLRDLYPHLFTTRLSMQNEPQKDSVSVRHRLFYPSTPFLHISVSCTALLYPGPEPEVCTLIWAWTRLLPNSSFRTEDAPTKVVFLFKLYIHAQRHLWTKHARMHAACTHAAG